MKPGYKQTEVGVIPEDWEVHALRDLVDFLDGRRRPVKDSDRAKMRGEIPYYGASGIVDYVNAFIFDEELILLGEDGENILSRSSRLAFKISGKTWVNNHAHVMRTKTGVHLDFLVEYLESLDYAEYNTGTAQPKLNKLVCSGIPVLYPPLPEQEAIAEILTDADEWIAALERLIEKKRSVKQGAMQELLTGKRRLPGFEGEWVERRLGEVGECLRGVSYKGDSDLSTHDKTHTKRLLRSNNIQNDIVVIDDIQFVNASRASSQQILQQSDILICMANGSKHLVGKAGLFMIDDDHDYTFGAFMGCFRTRLAEANPTFVFYLFLTTHYRDYINILLAGSSINNLRPSNIESLEFSMPPLPEQTAIAAILSDMDDEIALLEGKLAKARLMKQGMMQALLTGRVRVL
jgi:type I restriction enzyme, S subunit